jgi:hypothetical protein
MVSSARIEAANGPSLKFSMKAAGRRTAQSSVLSISH